MNKLLQRQIRKFLPEELQGSEILKQFLNAVNDSYNAYERDHELENRAFKLSEDEYIAVNEQLKREITLKKVSINKLKESIVELDITDINHESDDLLDIVSYLDTQIGKRKRAEEELQTTANRLSSLILNMQAGILVEDDTRHIVLTNQFFCDMFEIPVLPELLKGSDCSGSAEKNKLLFKNPEEFVSRILTLVTEKKLVIDDELELINGRFLERDYIPIFIGNDYKGHLWKYRDISTRKKAEAALKASQELWQFALEGAGDGVWEYNIIKNEIFYSKQYKKMLGYEDEEFKNDVREWTSRIHPDDFLRVKDTDKKYIDKKILSHHLEYRVKHKNGQWVWILDRGKVLNYTVDGRPERIIGTHADITHQKETEEELRRLSLVASANKNGVVFTRPNGEIFWRNEGFSELTGYEKNDILGKTPIQLLEGELTGREQLFVMIDHFLTGQNFNVDLICYRKDGSWFWARTKGQSVLDSEGKVLHYFAVLEDISAEKESQRKLAEFEHRFRVALEKIGDNMWEHDFIVNKTYFSNTANHMLGYALDDSIDKASFWWDQTLSDDRHLLTENDARYRTGSIDHHNLEYRVLAKGGAIRWVLDRGVVIEKDSRGYPLRIVGTHTDITERKLSEHTLRVNEEKYRSIIANMNLGLLEVDSNELIVYANQSFCDMCGYDLEEIVNKKASILFAKGENYELIEAKNDARKKGVSDAYEVAIKNKKGELKWWLISGAPRFNDSGIFIGSIGIHLDITAQKQLEMDLYDARENAEQSSEAKEIFLANMSHEIRTPMNAILGMGRQLKKSTLDEKQAFYLGIMNNAAEHLLVVINDILDISKIEAGKLNLEQIGFKPIEIVHHCTQIMTHRAEEKGLSLINYTEEQSPAVLLGDPYRLTQVLLNLLSNSVKFTENGHVAISCDILPPEMKNQWVIITVSDTGIGMDEEFLDNLFQKFSQEDKTTARKFGGTGLGMSISKQLVELMNGKIDVKSIKNKGTTITLQIPFKIGTVKDLPEIEQCNTDTALLSGKRILLVEDNEMNRLVATTILHQYNIIVTEVINGAEAVKALKLAEYDLVLMDVQMPVLNGLEATRVIRQQKNKTIPIIALTANAIKGESDKCIQAGMNDFLSKPFEEKTLLYILLKWISKIEITELGNRSAGSADKDVESPLYDLAKLESISAGNPEFILKMVKLFVDHMPSVVREIRNAYTENRFDIISKLAHSIKPSIDSMGIISLHKEIRAIENFNAQNESTGSLEKNILWLENISEEVTKQLSKNFPQAGVNKLD